MPFPPLVEPVSALSDAERARTARHASLAAFGEIGQRRLAAAHVAIIGAGGLGSPALLALAAAGVGTLTIIDDDTVDASNLQRQVMHRLRDVGAAKVHSAVRAAADLSPETTVVAVAEKITADNARALLDGVDLVVDGTDTFATREVVATACEELALPLVWGVVQEFHAQITVFWSVPTGGADPVVLSDLYPTGSTGDVPTCADVGVLGALCLQVGGVMAIEAIKLLTGTGEPLLGRVLIIDGLRARHSEVALRPAHARAAASAVSAPAPPADESAPRVRAVDLEDAVLSGATLLDVREPDETARGVIPGSVLRPLAEVLAAPEQTGAGPFIVVCKAGGRARRAAEALRRVGIDASVLAGGIDAWTAPESGRRQS